MVKEEPNTNGVIAWPNATVDEFSPSRLGKARRKSRDPAGMYADGLNTPGSIDGNQEDEFEESVTDYVSLTVSPLSRYWGEKVEFSLMFFLGSVAWVMGVNYGLRYLKFPFHLHQKEVIVMYTMPIFIVYAVLKLIDRMTVPPGPQDQTGETSQLSVNNHSSSSSSSSSSGSSSSGKHMQTPLRPRRNSYRGDGEGSELNGEEEEE